MTTTQRAAVRERPILFSSAMVQAILAGRKTQTRRFLHEARGSFWGHAAYEPRYRLDGTWGWYVKDTGEEAYLGGAFRCPYGVPGDRLWVRETWALRDDVDWKTQPEKAAHYVLHREGYRGDLGDEYHHVSRWRSGRFMPRVLSRITLEITDVRVQKPQEISEGDAIAEGAERVEIPNLGDLWRFRYPDGGDGNGALGKSARNGYSFLWDQINDADGRRWRDNPYVWAISFRRAE